MTTEGPKRMSQHGGSCVRTPEWLAPVGARWKLLLQPPCEGTPQTQPLHSNICHSCYALHVEFISPCPLLVPLCSSLYSCHFSNGLMEYIKGQPLTCSFHFAERGTTKHARQSSGGCMCGTNMECSTCGEDSVVGDGRPALCQRAGLVKDNDPHFVRPLQRISTLAETHDTRFVSMKVEGF